MLKGGSKKEIKHAHGKAKHYNVCHSSSLLQSAESTVCVFVNLIDDKSFIQAHNQIFSHDCFLTAYLGKDREYFHSVNLD